MNIHWTDWCWSWSSSTLVTWCEELTHWKSPWWWERLKAGGEGYDRGWDGWRASLTKWTWIWASSGRWRRTGKPGVVQSMGSQRAGHDWVTEQQQMFMLTPFTPLGLLIYPTSSFHFGNNKIFFLCLWVYFSFVCKLICILFVCLC